METSKDMDFYQVSGGGVTFSGGEPLVQLSFLRALVEKHRQEGIHTAIETSLYCDFAAIDSLLGFVDLFIFDLKIIDEQKHIEYTGVSSASILANAEKLFQAGCPTIVRIPLVPGITDTEENISAMVRFLEKNNRNGILYVSLLPYHCFGDGKCNALGGRREFRPPHANPAIKDAVKHFQRLGIETKVGY